MLLWAISRIKFELLMFAVVTYTPRRALIDYFNILNWIIKELTRFWEYINGIERVWYFKLSLVNGISIEKIPYVFLRNNISK